MRIGSLNIEAFTDLAFPLFVVWLLMSIRFMGLTMVFPWFTYLNLPMTVRFAFAAAMGLPFAFIVMKTPGLFPSDAAVVDLALLAGKEFTIGAGIGLIAGIPIWAAQGAGEIIDTYRGSSAGNLFDPSLTTETSELGVVFTTMTLAVITWTGGLQSIIWAIYGSFMLWSPFDLVPVVSADGAKTIFVAIGLTLVNALSIAGVMLAALFAIDMAFGLASRSTRQFQVFELSLNLKNLAYAALMPLMALPILQLISKQLRPLDDLLELLKVLVP